MTTASPDDPFLWLEQTESPRALGWVKTQNDRSLGVLKSDARYGEFHADALKVLEATDRIPAPTLVGSAVYNFWQDANQIRGLWRRTGQADYAEAVPSWEPVLDLDTLSKAEHANWVWKGANCPAPRFDRCLVNLSDGGEDAVRVREFDLATKAFKPGGFELPRGKQSADWLDDDTLIVAREWTPGAVTHSGYPYIVKTLKRGQPLDQATEVFRGEVGDVAVDPTVLRDAQHHKLVLIVRATSFFETEITQITAAGPHRLHLPLKTKLHGLLNGALILTVEQDWRFGGQDYKAGSLLAFTPDELADEGKASGAGHLLLAPNSRQSIEQVEVTANRVVAVVYENVRGRLMAFVPGAGGWSAMSLPVRDDSSVGIATASEIDDTLYYNVEGFLEPTRLWRAATTPEAPTLVKSLPARFDASCLEVEQHEVASSDGTKIPYFLVHKKGLVLNGSNPTLLYAYGGFQASMLPSYSATIGKLWLERGGVYVLANIRGGGEFGPAWHEAGLKTHRQLIYDDFAAVGKDLIAREITSARRLGIEGGSNGGLLVGVEFNQHPDLWHAVVIQVPLLDMLRFEQLGAGASWVGEYGTVVNPDERAFLNSISPYHNLKAGVAYPRALLRHLDQGRPGHPRPRPQDGGEDGSDGPALSLFREYRRWPRRQRQPRPAGSEDRTGIHVSNAKADRLSALANTRSSADPLTRAAAWFEELRDRLVVAFEELEDEAPGHLFPGAPGRFELKPWVRAEGGGGVGGMLKGRFFEKCGLHITRVHGTFTPEMAATMPGGADDPQFVATGVSLIAHMVSPRVPAVHMNTRYLATSRGWWGGGSDLTPLLADQRSQDAPDAVLFHDALRRACDAHHPDWYERFKAECDRYFFLPHRNEPRGIGGIFYDRHDSGDWERGFCLHPRCRLGSARRISKDRAPPHDRAVDTGRARRAAHAPGALCRVQSPL